MAHVILSIIGPDQPGLVRRISEALAASGGNWLESRMARLEGHFAGIVTVDASEGFLQALPQLQTDGLRITATVIAPAQDPAHRAAGPRLRLEVVGQDRPGIVHEVTQVLAACGANIEEMTTGVANAAFSGEALFRAVILLRAPDDDAAMRLRAGLERIGNDIAVDTQTLRD